MLDSLLSDDNKNLIKNLINDFVFPVKIYCILILILFIINTYYIFKIYESNIKVI
jgi:hypothetical protein